MAGRTLKSTGQRRWWLEQQPEKMATFPKTFVTTTGERFPVAAAAAALLSTR